MLSRWNWHIFPRAETALSYAITLSECCAFGCVITAFNLESASVEEPKKTYYNNSVRTLWFQIEHYGVI